MKRRHAFGLVAVVSLLPGCWLQPGFGPERQNSNPFETGLTEDSIGSITLAWDQRTDVAVAGQPLATGTTVVFGGYDFQPDVFRVVAMDQRTGALRWQRDLGDRGPGEGEVLSVSDDEVLVLRDLSTGGGELTTLDLATGATVEAVTLPEHPLVEGRMAVVGGDVIAYRAADPLQGRFELVVRSRETFALLWTSPIGDIRASTGSLVMGHGQIYAVDNSPSPVIRAFPAAGCGAATCDPTWTTPFPALPLPDDRQLDGFLLAATDDGHLLFHHRWSNRTGYEQHNDLVALASDGQVDWVTPLSDLIGAAVVGDQVFVTGPNPDSYGSYNGLAAIRTTTGAVDWMAKAPSYLAGNPVVAGGLVYARGAEGGDILVFDVDGCGEPVCPELKIVRTGLDTGGVRDFSVTGSTLFVNKEGVVHPADLYSRLMAFRPSG